MSSAPHVGDLASQQRRFLASVTAPAEAPGASDGLLRGRATGGQPLLGIYRHAYRQRLLSALRDNFGVLPLVMGDDAFDALGEAYLAAFPSRHPSIRWFGGGLADFMAADDSQENAGPSQVFLTPSGGGLGAARPCGRSDLVPHPALIDLARMEWALRAAFDAEDAPVLQAAELAAVPPEAWAGLVLRFHPSLRQLSLSWRVEPVWRALQDIAPGEEPELPEPEPGAHALLVWRPALETRWRSASSELEAGLLQRACDGETFGALCEHASDEVGEAQAVPQVVALLQQWVGEGLLTGWR